MTSAEAYFYAFNVKLRFWCPKCEEPVTFDMNEWDVHELLEGLFGFKCKKCGETFKVVLRDD